VSAFTRVLVLTAAELAILEDFYHLLLADGSLSFTGTDPVSGLAEEMRFRSRPRYSHPDGRWRAEVDLEALP
jgi:hypothetical protein